MRWLPSLLLLAVLTGCAPAVHLTPYSDLHLAPTHEVAVLQNKPTRAYEVLGEMWVSANDSKGVLAMRKKAMAIGADAIVLEGERNAGAVAVPLQGAPGGAVAVPIKRSYAVAIRYKR